CPARGLHSGRPEAGPVCRASPRVACKSEGLSDRRSLTAQRRRLAGFDQRRGAEIDVADVGEYADNRHHGRAEKANDYDLQVGRAVGAIHRMVHGILPVFYRLVAAAGPIGSLEATNWVLRFTCKTRLHRTVMARDNG